MTSIETYTRMARSWFLGLSARERTLVGGVFAVLLVFAVAGPLSLLHRHFSVSDEQIQSRTRELADIGSYLKRYSQLRGAVQQLESSYDRSQMTFEQVTNELDRIVKESVGNDNYELKRNPSSRLVGEALELQGFTLRIRALTLEQLVVLLHTIENGRSPLYLNRVDVVRDPGNKAILSSTLELTTVGRRRTAQG